MEKKGLQRDMLVHMIIVIATLVILVIFWTQLSSVLYGQTSVETCRTSVLAHSIGEKPLIPHMSLECPRKFVNVDNEGYTTYYADELPIDKDDTAIEVSFDEGGPERGEIYEIIAEEMAECWHKLHEGEVQVFGGESFGGVETHCLICSEVTFSGNFGGDSLGDFGEFRNFLEQEKMLKHGQEHTYLDFLSGDEEYSQYIYQSGLRFGVGGGDDSLNLFPEEDEQINAEDTYYVYFRSITHDKLSKFSSDLVEDTPLLNLVGSEENLQYINLGKSDEINNQCNLLVN
ncbi:MAG: hypothetical protein ACOCQG_01720 [Candidatus Nanoarchaeia archaeon]